MFSRLRWDAFYTNEKVDFFIEDIALITLKNKLVLRPKKKKEQFFRPVQPICLLTETSEAGNDKKLKILQTKAWHDNSFEFIIAGM